MSSMPTANNRSGQPTTAVVKKKNTQAGDPAVQPNANAEAPILADRLGPRFAIRAKWQAPVDPVAAPTQANGRLLPPANPYGSVQEFADGSQLGKTI